MTFRIEFWPGGNEADIDKADDEEPKWTVSPAENLPWAPRFPPESARPEPIAFVDGAQRIEAWGVVEVGSKRANAALASIAIGATISRLGGAQIEGPIIERLLAVSGDLPGGAGIEPLVLSSTLNSMMFRPLRSEAVGRLGVNSAINSRRRRLELDLSTRLSREGVPLVVQDGRISFGVDRIEPVVGMAKRLEELYVCEEERPLIFDLPTGARTPLRRIKYEDSSILSWFLRLAPKRPIEQALAGVVRFEVSAGVGEDEAARLADVIALHLPSYASKPWKDKRAPENLVPIGSLEAFLHHKMGLRDTLQRAIERQLYEDI